MSYTIAIAGKGGTGKTTIATLLVRLIKENKLGSILAIDADPNSNLAEGLGIEIKETISSILDDISLHPEIIPKDMSKDRFIEYQIHTAISEGDGFDLLTMGRPEGPGCYCYVNNVLRNIMGKLTNDYDYIVIDNEAGLEHLSRRTLRACDALVVISDATPAGLRAAKRINLLVEELKIKAKKRLLLLNRFAGKIEKEKIKDLGLDYIGSIPEDNLIQKISLDGGSLMDLDNTAVGLQSLDKLGGKIWS
ncbi:MAG: AAA family ATPase [Candidatus Omnitrophica bacterium]|nr:AAA family ATPase [Candidatus Omnitrophota bacterium]